MNDLITPAEADALIAANLRLLPEEMVNLADADRRILRAPLVADRPLPPYNRVMMDGICFRSGEASAAGNKLTVHGLHAAGDPTPENLPAGHCWEIMTGAQLPKDCDTVVPYEEVNRDGSSAVLTQAPPPPGKHIHALGSDFSAGAELVPTGTPVSSRVAAVAATIGATNLLVSRRPVITVLTTGDELISPDQSPEPHQVRRSNDAALRTALHRWGPCEVVTLHLPDSIPQLREALQDALASSDLILSCGGISKGKRDHVRPVLEELVGPPAFHGIAQRPGKPLAFWSGVPPVVALPGNPMSVLICFHRYVLPALHRMSGQPHTVTTAPLTSEVRFQPPLHYFLPVQLTSDFLARPLPLQNSGDFASAIESTGFIELPADSSTFPPSHPASYTPWL